MMEATTLQYEKVKLLFDYTKFHIGLYTTLGTIFVAMLSITSRPIQFHAGYLGLAVALIATAGFAGGIIASSLPHHTSLPSFWTTATGRRNGPAEDLVPRAG